MQVYHIQFHIKEILEKTLFKLYGPYISIFGVQPTKISEQFQIAKRGSYGLNYHVI